MANALDERIGLTTAYGYAKLKGYTGTEEQFAQALANAGITLEQIETVIDGFVNTTLPNAVQSVTDEGTAQVSNVNSAGASQVQAVTTEGETQVSAVNTAGSTQVTNVTNEGTTQVAAVNTAGTTQTTAVNTAGSTQVSNVNNAGSQQIAAIKAKGEETKQSIPSDYTALSDSVEDLKSALGKYHVNNGNVITTFYVNSGDEITINILSVVGYSTVWVNPFASGDTLLTINTPGIYTFTAGKSGYIQFYSSNSATRIDGYMYRKGINSEQYIESVVYPQDSDVSAYILSMLNKNKVVYLSKGTYYINTHLIMPDGTSIIGCGYLTRIRYAGSSDCIVMGNNCTVSNVQLDGGNYSTPESIDPSGTVALRINNGKCGSVIDNVHIQGFTRAGILNNGQGYDFTRSISVSNCVIDYCGAGILCEEHGEYGNFENLSVMSCCYGVWNKGGNNKFANCGFENNRNAFAVISAGNNGHGSCVGCSFNHSLSSGCIVIQSTINGFIFSACNIFKTGVQIKGTNKGVIFNGCILSDAPILSDTNDSFSLFANCTFRTTPSIEDVFDKIKFAGCYSFDGTPVE